MIWGCNPHKRWAWIHKGYWWFAWTNDNSIDFNSNLKPQTTMAFLVSKCRRICYRLMRLATDTLVSVHKIVQADQCGVQQTSPYFLLWIQFLRFTCFSVIVPSHSAVFGVLLCANKLRQANQENIQMFVLLHFKKSLYVYSI